MKNKNINTNINYIVDAYAIQKFQYLVVPKYNIIREKICYIHQAKKIFQKEFEYTINTTHFDI